MTDQPSIRQQLIEQAARIAGLIDWNPTCLPGQHEMTIVRQVLESAGSLGLLTDPEHALDLENAKGTLAAVRWKLGTPEGRAVSMHAAEVRTERDEAVALCANLQAALLPRLAELAEQAGKLRSAEWLRTCATLPMEQWPPAPAYKGPMVPAAELAEAQRERDTWESEYERVRDLKMTDLAAALAERDALQARIDAAVAELDASCPPPRLSRIRAALQGDQAAEEAGRD